MSAFLQRWRELSVAQKIGVVVSSPLWLTLLLSVSICLFLANGCEAALKVLEGDEA